jgi:hypothetical protein
VASDGSDTIAENQPRTGWLAFWLILGNFAVGMIGCGIRRYYDDDLSLSRAAFIGMVYGQMSLVGLWGGLSNRNWLVRLAGVLVGLYCVAGLFIIGVSLRQTLAVNMVVSVGLMTAGLLAVCRFFGLRIVYDEIGKAGPKPPQFSIRQLMGLTLVVASCIALARWLVPNIASGPFLLDLYNCGVLFVLLGLVSAWAILGTKHPKLGILAVLLIAPIFGLGREAVVRGGGQNLAKWITYMMTESLVLIVSLYVIRQFGFRIRWQRKGKASVVAEELHGEDDCGTLEH